MDDTKCDCKNAVTECRELDNCKILQRFKREGYQAMSNENYAAVEVCQGEYHQGFKSQCDAVKYIHQRLDAIERDDEYSWRVVKVLDEWNSDSLLPGEL